MSTPEGRVRQLDLEFEELLPNTINFAVITSMFQTVVQDFVCQPVEENVRSQRHGGPEPESGGEQLGHGRWMYVSEVMHEWGYDMSADDG